MRSRRTGAAVRENSRRHSAVRAHRYVCDVRADDADVAGAAVGDEHEPATAAVAISAFGLHTTRRETLAAAPTQRLAGGTPLRCEYSKHRGGTAGRVLRVLAAHAVWKCAARRVRCGAAGREPRCAGTQEGTRQCVRTAMFVTVEPTTLTWPLLPSPIPTSPPSPLACTPRAAQSSRRRLPKGWPAVPHCAASTHSTEALRVLTAPRRCEYSQNRGAASTLSTEAVTPVGNFGYSQPS